MLDLFLDFQVFMIYSTPIQDKQLKFSGIKNVYILKIYIKFHYDLYINCGARSISRYLSFQDFKGFLIIKFNVYFYTTLWLIFSINNF